jgi:long-chain acyl-CoA synthetase
MTKPPSPPSIDLRTLLEQIATRSADARQRPALTFYRGKSREARLTYDELLSRVAALAGHLRAIGIDRGDRVAILSPNRIEIPILVLALMRIGAVVVPLNPAASVEDFAYVLEHSGARAVWATKDLAEKLRAMDGAPLIYFVEEIASLDGPIVSDSADLADELGIILYTSGTTGRPKGVALRQRNLVANAWSMARNFRLDGTPQLAVLPLYHAHAFGFGLMTALSTGGHLVFTERLEPFTWADVIRAESIEVTSVVPTLLPMLLAARVNKESLPSLKHLLVSSAPLPNALAREFLEKTHIPLIQGWGLSEYTNFACCLSPFDDESERTSLLLEGEVPSIGPSLDGTEVRIVDGNGTPITDPERRGELQIRGHSTMLGYYKDVENSSATLDSEGWLKTGDEGYFQPRDNRPNYYVTGRLKEIIIRGGDKYSPLAIERRITEALPDLAGKLAIVGFPHKTHGEEIGAYLELASIDTIRPALTETISKFPVEERPKVILFGDTPIPRTHTGKVQRRKMQPWFGSHADHRGAIKMLPFDGSTQ